MAINPITLLVGFAENQLISWLTPDQEVDRLLKQTIAETFTEHGFPLTPPTSFAPSQEGVGGGYPTPARSAIS